MKIKIGGKNWNPFDWQPESILDGSVSCRTSIPRKNFFITEALENS